MPTEWVLLDIRIHLWSEDGRLLAAASQSTIVRMMPPHLIEAMRQGRAFPGAVGDGAGESGRDAAEGDVAAT